MWGCVRSTETQRIRTTSKFLGSSVGHSEIALCSSVTKVAQMIFLQTLQIDLTIDTETLSLSITTEKTHGSSVQHGLVNCLPPYLPTCQLFEFSGQGSTSGSTKKNLDWTWTGMPPQFCIYVVCIRVVCMWYVFMFQDHRYLSPRSSEYRHVFM